MIRFQVDWGDGYEFVDDVVQYRLGWGSSLNEVNGVRMQRAAGVLTLFGRRYVGLGDLSVSQLTTIKPMRVTDDVGTSFFAGLLVPSSGLSLGRDVQPVSWRIVSQLSEVLFRPVRLISFTAATFESAVQQLGASTRVSMLASGTFPVPPTGFRVSVQGRPPLASIIDGLAELGAGYAVEHNGFIRFVAADRAAVAISLTDGDGIGLNESGTGLAHHLYRNVFQAARTDLDADFEINLASPTDPRGRVVERLYPWFLPETLTAETVTLYGDFVRAVAPRWTTDRWVTRIGLLDEPGVRGRERVADVVPGNVAQMTVPTAAGTADITGVVGRVELTGGHDRPSQRTAYLIGSVPAVTLRPPPQPPAPAGRWLRWDEDGGWLFDAGPASIGLADGAEGWNIDLATDPATERSDAGEFSGRCRIDFLPGFSQSPAVCELSFDPYVSLPLSEGSFLVADFGPAGTLQFLVPAPFLRFVLTADLPGTLDEWLGSGPRFIGFRAA